MGLTIFSSTSLSGVASTANTDQYWLMYGRIQVATTENTKDIKFRSAGKLKNLFCKISANSVAATSTFTLRKNAGDITNVLSIGSSATGNFEDTTHEDTIAAADLISFKTHPGAATGTYTLISISCVFSATTDTVTMLGTETPVNYTVASTTNYIPLYGQCNAVQATEANVKQRMREAGTLKYLACNVATNRAQTSTLRLRKNAANGNGAVSITGGGASGWYEDTSNTDTVTAGEDWNYSILTGTGVDTLTMRSVKSEFISTNNDGALMASFVTPATIADATNRFYQVCGTASQATTETGAGGVQQTARQAFVVSELSILVTQNDVGSASTLDFRKNAAATALTTSITASTTGVFSDSTHSVTLAASDLINYQVTVPSVASAHTITVANISAWTNLAANQNITVTLTTETTTISDSIARSQGFNRALSTETTTIGETMAIRQTLIRNPQETTAIGETLARLLAANRSLSTETTTISESPALARVIGKVRALATETVTISEVSLNRMLAATRALPETTSIGETLTRLLAANRALGTETTTIGETLTRVKGVVRALGTETVAIGESLARMLAATRNPIENTSIGETLARQLVANRALATETVVISDSLTQLKTIVRALATETVTIGESLARILAANRALGTETVTIGDSLARIRGINRALSTETVTIGETLNRMLAASRALPETVSISDSIARMLAANRILATENTTIGEALTRLLAANRALATQTTTIGDSLSYVYTPGGGGPTNYERTLSDTVVIGEALARMLAANRTLSTEVTAISDSLARSRGVNRALATENVSIGESLSRLLAATRQIIETTTLTDSLARLLALSRSLSDTTAVSDSIAKIIGRVRTLVENTSIGETLTRRFTGTRTLIETINISDILARLHTPFVVPTQLASIVAWLKAKYSISNPPKE